MAKLSDLAPIDWERVEADYRAGILSVREIAKLAGCTHTAINKRAAKLGWDRNLESKIRAKAAALVSAQAVSKEVAKATEADTVSAVANLLATIELGQRRVSDVMVSIGDGMLRELLAANNAPEVYGQVYDMLASGEEPDAALLRRVAEYLTSLPERAKTYATLTESTSRSILTQRKVYSMDAEQKSANDVDSFENLLDMANSMLGRLK